MVIVTSPTGVVGPLTNGLFMAYKWWLLLTSWDDPPSKVWVGFPQESLEIEATLRGVESRRRAGEGGERKRLRGMSQVTSDQLGLW